MNTPSRVVGCIVKHKQYVVAVKPTAAQDLLFTSTYDSQDPMSNAPDKHGYQRPSTEGRFAEIASYFTADDNADKITPLIVSVRIDEPKDIERFLGFIEAGEISSIKTHFGTKVASLIDGQHRKGGLIRAWLDDNEFMPDIPLICYFGLTFVDEAELFNTINVTQRKLPKALIETTKGDITETDDASYAQKIRRIAFSLCRDSDSVWGPINGEEQINMTGVRDPNKTVTYEGLRRSTSNMFPTTLLARLEAIDDGLPLKYAKRYWRAISEECKEAWTGFPSTRDIVDPITGEKTKVKILYRIKDLVGVASLAKLAKDIITSDIEAKEPKRLEELASKLMEVDWEKRDDNVWMRSQAGFAGQKDLYEMLHALVYNDKHPGDVGYISGTVAETEVEAA